MKIFKLFTLTLVLTAFAVTAQARLQDQVPAEPRRLLVSAEGAHDRPVSATGACLCGILCDQQEEDREDIEETA